MNDKIKVGMTIYLEPVPFGNAWRHSSDIIETTVTKVGRKYFVVDKHNLKFSIEDMCHVTEYSSDYKAYLSRQEIEDKREVNILYDHLKRDFFGAYSNKELSLDQLRRISAITKE